MCKATMTKQSAFIGLPLICRGLPQARIDRHRSLCYQTSAQLKRHPVVNSTASSNEVDISRRSFVRTLGLSVFCLNLVTQQSPVTKARAQQESKESTSAKMSQVEVNDLVVGSGASPQQGQKLSMHYTLTLGGFQDQGGKVVDSSRSRQAYFSYVVSNC